MQLQCSYNPSFVGAFPSQPCLITPKGLIFLLGIDTRYSRCSIILYIYHVFFIEVVGKPPFVAEAGPDLFLLWSGRRDGPGEIKH